MRAFSVNDVDLQGTTLVEASAGTGKTYAISTLYARLLIERQLDVRQILVVTFTEAATAELRQRIRQRLRDSIAACEALHQGAQVADPTLAQLFERHGLPLVAKKTLQAALLDIDEAAIFTIHGFCQRVLRDNAFLSGAAFDVELLRDTRPLVDEILADFWATRFVDAPLVLIEHLVARGIQLTNNATRGFANRVAERPELQVLPNRLEAPPALDTALLLECHAAAAAAFDPEEVSELLLSGSLDGRSYNRRYVPGWCAQVADYLAAGPSPHPPKDLLERFDPRTLQAKLKPGAALPQSSGLAAVARLARAAAELRDALDEHQRWLCRQLLEYVQTEMVRRKRERAAISFDDLLQQLEGALEQSLALRKLVLQRYPVALLDEFQDTDAVQLSLFQKIYEGAQATVFLIGDPKQSIYSFRGADLFAYVRAAARIPAERRFTLATNYRSDDALVRAVNHVFGQTPNPFLYETLQYPAVSARPDAVTPLSIDPQLGAAPLMFRFFATDAESPVPGPKRVGANESAVAVAHEIGRTLRSNSTLHGRRLSPRDFAVLTRTNHEAFECQAALSALRIPSVVLGDRSVYEYGEAAELQAVLAAVLEPSDSRRLKVALTTELIGLDAQELLRLDQSDDEWNVWVERFRALHARWVSDGFIQMIRQLMAETAIPERLLRLLDGERRMTNLLQLLELLHTETIERHLGPSGTYVYLCEQRTREQTTDESEQIRLESDDDAVVLTTIHKSKGLEYSIVICPSLASARAEGGAHDLSTLFHDDAGHTCIDLGSEDLEHNQRLMQAEGFSENLRLAYVALTRARHRCVVFWGRFRNFEGSSLGYLLHGREASGPALSAVDTLQRHREHIKQLEDADLVQTLERLCADADCVGQSPPLVVPDVEVAENDADAVALTARKAEPLRSATRRTSSFSELVAHSDHGPTPRADDARDVDAVDGLDWLDEGQSRPLDARVVLADFPGGARTGNFFHTLLENSDFGAEPRATQITSTLLDHGLAEDLAPLVATALVDVVGTPLRPGMRLADVASARRINEMEFLIPVNLDANDGARGFDALTCRRLADAFKQHPSAELPADYADRLASLDFLPLTGFLKGFIDLVFEHEGQWFVVDYKTNQLGAHYRDYGVDALRVSMAGSHYFLQYHLYALALDRFLRQRVPGYDYDTHFGGAYYLYLRGMRPANTSETGVFHEKPPWARLQALSDCLAAGRTRT